MPAPAVYIIILNWNGWQDTIECLASIQQLDYPDYRVVVVDNGSDDDSRERILAWAKGKVSGECGHTDHGVAGKPVTVFCHDGTTAKAGGEGQSERELTSLPAARKLVLILLNENVGFAAGSNIGIQYALATDADYVWLLNNDTVVAPDSLSKLVDFMEANPDYQGVTGQIRLYDNPATVWNCGGALTWYGVRRYDYARAPVSKTPQSGFKRISFMPGCAALFSTRLFGEMGLLSEAFFFGEEDFELSQRVKKRGYKLACRYDAIIYHKVGVSIAKASREKDIARIYIHYLNRFVNMRTFWPHPVWQVWRFAYLLYIIPMLRLRYGVSWRSIWLLCRSLLENSAKLHEVSKSIFEQAMRQWEGLSR